MLHKILFFCLLLVPVQLFGSTAPVAQLMDAPPPLTNIGSPTINVAGEGVVAYRYKINNGIYSDEISISDPIRFGADVKVFGQTFKAGSRELQDYLDRRTNLSLSTDFIDSIEFSNVSSDVNVVYTLNPKRAFLQEYNIFIAEGAGAGDLRPSVIRVSSLTTNGLQELFIRGGVLRFDQQNNPARMFLEMPPGEKIVLSPIAGADTVITVNGEVVSSGANIELPSLFDGTSVNITCTTASGTLQYELVVKERAFDGQSAIGYFFRSKNPSEDYLSIPNTGAGLASVSINLNGRLFADNNELANTILSLPEKYPGETIPRKLWRFIRDNRYHYYPVTGDKWGHNPALFMNSIGYGFCDDVASVYSQLATLLGYTSRVWELSGHVVPEVLVDGRWEMYDTDMEVYYYNDAGQVAGVEELVADPSLILSPRSNVVSLGSVAYFQYVADIYSSAYNNSITNWFTNNPLKYRLTIDIPPAGRLELPKNFVTPFPITYDFTAPLYTNARVVVPRSWTGSIRPSLLIHTIGNEGANSLSVIARNDSGVWQADPTTVSFNIHTYPPIVVAYQSAGFYNTNQPVQFRLSKPATIHYTVDGSVPSTASATYNEPFSISPGALIKYFAIDAIGNQSSIKSYSPPASSIALTVDRPSPLQAGGTVTFSAAAGGGSGSYEYFFVYLNPNTGTWGVGQSYSATPTWTWDTTGFKPGTYSIQVWTRSAGSQTQYEAYKGISYILTAPPPATAVTVAIDRASPLQAGGKVTFSASAGGGSGSYDYYFTCRNSNTRAWVAGQAYSTKSTWTWDTTGLEPGTYSVQIWTRSTGSPAQYEVYKGISYTLIAPQPPATAITVAVDRASPLQTGGKVVFSAAASGGSGTYDYFFAWYNPSTGTWSAGQPYSGKSTWMWDTAGLNPGIYPVQVWTRSTGSPAQLEATKDISYTLIAPQPPVTAVTVAVDRASPLQAGGKITFSASASGGSGSYDYYFTCRNSSTSSWVAGQAYSGKSTWTWDTTGLEPGTYSVQIWTRSTGSPAQYDVYKGISYTLIAPQPPATAITVAVDRASPLQAGGKVAFSASASGGSSAYEYYFTWYNPSTGTWSAGQPYSAKSTWTWDTAGLNPGTYSIQVWARSAGSPAQYEVYKGISYTLIVPPPPVTAVTVAVDRASPLQTGGKVAFSASASGGSSAYEYYFTWYNPSTGTWSAGQSYSGKPTWTWDTAGLNPGTYSIQVWARSAGSLAQYDVYSSTSYTLIAPPPPVTAVTVAVDRASPLQTGGKVAFSASASGGSSTYDYYFTWYNPSTGTWSAGQSYSGKSTWTWDTAGLNPGAYTIQVWTRSAGSLAQYEVYREISYTLIAPPEPATSLTVAADRASPLQAGGKIAFSAAAGGGSGSYDYYFTWYNPNSGTWVAGQGYSATSTWTWDTAGLNPGAYTIQVWTRSAGSLAQYEVYREISYTLIAPPAPATAVTVAVDRSSPLQAGGKITFSATAGGGSGSYDYYFTWYNPNSGTWSAGQTYSATSTWTWDTAGLNPGTYSVQVWTRSAGSLAPYDVYKDLYYSIN